MPKGVRRKENRTITISLAKSLVAEIDQLARAERRSRSNWIVVRLEELVKEKAIRAGQHRPPTPLSVSSSPTLRERLKKTKLTSH